MQERVKKNLRAIMVIHLKLQMSMATHGNWRIIDCMFLQSPDSTKFPNVVYVLQTKEDELCILKYQYPHTAGWQLGLCWCFFLVSLKMVLSTKYAGNPIRHEYGELGSDFLQMDFFQDMACFNSYLNQLKWEVSITRAIFDLALQLNSLRVLGLYELRSTIVSTWHG